MKKVITFGSKLIFLIIILRALYFNKIMLVSVIHGYYSFLYYLVGAIISIILSDNNVSWEQIRKYSYNFFAFTTVTFLFINLSESLPLNLWEFLRNIPVMIILGYFVSNLSKFNLKNSSAQTQ